MREVRNGDVRRLEALFDRHAPTFLRYSMKMTGNRAWSEDLVQEIFVRILRHRETFRDGFLFTTWAFRIARNAYVDQYRKRRWEVSTEKPVERPVEATDELETEQDLRLLRRALAQLPEPQREVLVLARFQQMPYEDIAELLDIEVGTVKTRVHRAIKQLRDIYQDLTRTPHALRTTP